MQLIQTIFWHIICCYFADGPEELSQPSGGSSESKVRGQADTDDREAGKIEEITCSSDASPSSILSLAGQSRKSRKAKGRKERKAEQLRRKVLSLSPERLSQEAKRVEEQSVNPSRDQSPAMSERSSTSSKKGRHWSKRGRPIPMGGTMWPWSKWQNSHAAVPSPLASTSSTQQAPPVPSSSEPKPPPIGFTSSASADVARLKRLEKSYAEALRTSMPKPQRRKWGAFPAREIWSNVLSSRRNLPSSLKILI